MAHPPRPGLGPGFWQVAIGLTIFNVIVTILIVLYPIQNLLPEAAAPAKNIDDLFKLLSVFGNAIFVYVVGFMVYFMIVWRRRASDPPDAIGIQIHDAPKLELWWTIIPSILVVIIAIYSVKIWADLQNSPGDALTMEAIGHQFKFEFRYPGLKNSVYDEMHLPIDTPVSVHVTSVDVIHSFWVPEVRIKADMVPGLIQTLRFTPNNIGKYRVICTEFCGTNHGDMVATMYIDSAADFQKWLAATAKSQGAGQAPLSLAKGDIARGRALFGQKCSTCHSTGPFDQKIVGPGLGKLASDPAHPNVVTGKPVTAANVAGILQNGYSGNDLSTGKPNPPIGTMPNQQANAISNTDIANLVAFLLSMSKK